MHQFDPNLPDLMQGDITGVALIAPPVFTPGLPNRVIDPDQDFTLHIEWEAYGALVPLWLDALSSAWRIEVFAESLGGGPEIRIGSAQKSKADTTSCTVNGAAVNCTKWEVDVVVTAGTLLARHLLYVVLDARQWFLKL